MDFTHLRLDSGPVSKVILTRPEARNAMSDVTLRELTEAFRALARDPEVRVVIIAGEGKDFCAGADINWMRAGGRMPAEAGKKDARLFADMLRAVDECPVPVIVAAQGNVFGGGLGLLAACDVALIADNVKMSFSETRLGIMPAVISNWVLPKIGVANARRYFLTAETFGAAEALYMSLVHEVVPFAELETRAMGIAAKIMLCAPGAVREAKALIPKLAGLPLDKRIDLTVDTLVRLRSGPEGQEGLSAFLEKRAPKWAVKL